LLSISTRPSKTQCQRLNGQRTEDEGRRALRSQDLPKMEQECGPGNMQPAESFGHATRPQGAINSFWLRRPRNLSTARKSIESKDYYLLLNSKTYFLCLKRCHLKIYIYSINLMCGYHVYSYFFICFAFFQNKSHTILLKLVFFISLTI